MIVHPLPIVRMHDRKHFVELAVACLRRQPKETIQIPAANDHIGDKIPVPDAGAVRFERQTEPLLAKVELLKRRLHFLCPLLFEIVKPFLFQA